MISVDISNIWGEVSLPDLLAMESEVAAAHEALMEGSDNGRKYPHWKNIASREPNPELFRILLAAERIRGESDVCVVVGTGESCLGSRAAMELLQGSGRNLGRAKGDPQILFAGNSFSTRSWNELLGLLKDRDVSVIVISGREMPTETAIAFRSLRWMLERKYGTDAAKRRIYAVTDPAEGALGQMVGEEGWESFRVCTEDRISVLSAAGLLIMAVAGIDIREILEGAADAWEEYTPGSFENPLWLYAAVRNLLYREGKVLEILASFEPGFHAFGRWWQQLFSGAEGKGLLPVAAEFPAELSGLGLQIQKERRNLFETILRFDPPENPVVIGSDWKNLDGLNFLEGKQLDFVEEQAYQAVIMAHGDSGVPVITMDCAELNDRKVGHLFCFLELCCGLCTGLLGRKNTDDREMKTYRQTFPELLGKPENDQ